MRRAFLTLAGGNLLSKGASVAREALFAAMFGTGLTAAAYRVSQTAFLLPTHALVGDTLSAGVLPLYKRAMGKSREDGQAVIIVAFAAALFVSFLITVCLIAFSSHLVEFIAPGMSEEGQRIAKNLLKITAIATPFYIIGNMLGYIEAAHGRFGSISARPVIINLFSIIGVIFAWRAKSDQWLAYATVVGYFSFFGITAYQLCRIGVVDISIKISKSVYISTIFDLIKKNAPLLALPFIAQFNVLIERIVSSHLGTDVIPGLDYARFITETATTLTAVPLGILTMSLHGGSRSVEAQGHIHKNCLYLLLFMVPASSYLLINSEFIVRLIFQRGAFNEDSVKITSTILSGSAFGLSLTVAGYFLIKGLNAQLRNREAIAIMAVAVLFNVGFNLIFWRFLGPVTLGLGASIYGCVLFAASVWRLGLVRQLAVPFFWLVVGAAVTIAADLILPSTGIQSWDMGVAGAVFLIIWASVFLLSPELRTTVLSILERSKIVKRREK